MLYGNREDEWNRTTSRGIEIEDLILDGEEEGEKCEDGVNDEDRP